MKNLILCFCISFYCIGNLSAQSDSTILALEDTLRVQVDSLDIAQTLFDMGARYEQLSDYNQALEKYREALRIRIDSLGEEHLDVAKTCKQIGRGHYFLGNYNQALAWHNKMLKIQLSKFEEYDTKLARTYHRLAVIYWRLDDCIKSLELNKKTVKIRESNNNESRIYLADTYHNMGNVYSELGNYKKALEANTKALDIRIDSFGKYHRVIAFSYMNMGYINYGIDQYEEALSFYNKAFTILKNQEREHLLDFAIIYNNKGNIYHRKGKYNESLKLYQEALNIRLKKLPRNHIFLASTYNNVGECYNSLKRHEEALSQYEKSLYISTSQLTDDTPPVVETYANIAKTYQALNKHQTADSLWQIVINQSLKRLNDTYLFLPDNQRLKYSKTFKEVYNSFYSFAAKHGSEDTKKLAAYLSLNTKSLALDYSVSTRQLIKNINDEALTALHNEINALNRNISQTELMTEEEREEKKWDITAMRDQQEDLTRQLLQNETLREKLYKTPVTWQDAQSKLKSKEALLDFVRFYEEGDSTWMYYAMLTRKGMSAPEFIRVTDQEAIIELLQADNGSQPNYIQSNKGNYKGLKALYQKIWQPLMPHLKGVKTVHLSPSGLLHRVDFDVLQDENDKYLADHFEFHYYTTMRDFTGKKKTNFLSKRFKRIQYSDAVFFGDINYGSFATEIASRFRDDIDPLPATIAEIEGAGRINEENGGLSIYITGNNATEDTIKHYSPDIMHFATHGKYLSSLDSLGKQVALQNRLHATGNPLQRSMLLLSGGGHTWESSEYIPRSDKDGILTAYEVTYLNLNNTKLAVLSACNTALGDIHDTEGVLGLQSAFKLAGVEHVVVSLWKVNDAATKELMIAFYKNLLDKKQDAPTALRKAKIEMRQNGAKPINWAGFILIE